MSTMVTSVDAEAEIRDLPVYPAFDVAFCHGLHHVAGTTRDGRKIDIWGGPRGASAM